MIRVRSLLPGAIGAALALLSWPAAAAGPALLPLPRSIAARTGGFALTRHSVITVPRGDAGARNAAERLADLIAVGRGPRLTIREGQSANGIRFVRAAGLGPEAYRIETGPAGAVVTASDDAGLFYGAVTLWQLVTQPGTEGTIPAVTIEDAPRYAWRGMMLDSARHFQSPAFIKRFIEWMAVNKLNRFHWHLVDDQGWRLQIRKYPRLTEVSAWL